MSQNLPVGLRLVEGIPDDRYPDWLDCWLGVFGGPVGSEPALVDFYRRNYPPERGLAVAAEDDAYIATNMAVDRELVLPGGHVVPAAAGTGGSAHPAAARQGLMRLTADMLTRRAVDEDKAIMIGGASEWPIYGRFGVGPATWCDAVEIDVRAAGLRDDVPGRGLRPRRVTAEQARELARELYRRQALEVPGEVLPPAAYWDRLTDDPALGRLEESLALGVPGPGPRFCLAVEDRGLVTYRVAPNWTAESAPHSTLHVIDFLALDAEAEGALWRHLFSVDLVREVHVWRLAVDSPLRWWVSDARRVRAKRQDALWLRPLDVPRLLSTREWACDGTLTLSVHDHLGFAEGTYRLTAESGKASCERTTTDRPDMEMDVSTLGAILLGGNPAVSLALSGRIRAAEARVAHLWDTMATPARAPHISYWF
uniref:Acyl-CoA N-acyltransferase n=1 Tax=Streptoalloteichus sp. ATCC 53650 TaxID=756733 RepID=K4P136_9PSEU|nr:acyl-CoA N-acyltransferase [Streptoalloteichus sp. ATCC 53650]